MIIFLIILATSIWVFIDSKKIGCQRGLLKGFFDLSPVAWFICSLLLWVVTFPAYLIVRPKIKLAAAQKSGFVMPASGADSIAQIEKLAELKSKGHITEEEFAQKKKQLLG